MENHNQIPYYEQWLGPWAMAEDAFLRSFELFRKTDLHLHMEKQEEAQQAVRSTRQASGQIAIINLTGKLMKQQASMGGGTSTVQARRDIRDAAKDPDVSAIMLRIDSPGGTAAGTKELADDIAAAAKRKPVHAYAEDMTASAAYWAASQSGWITANHTAIVGSIGTYGVVQDLSEMASKEGIKVHVIRAGEYKGAGTPGTEITEDHLADMQRIVDGLNSHFLTGVSKGRKMPIATVRELADGRAHLAAEALSLKLIDAVGSFDDAMKNLQKSVSQRGSKMQASLEETAVDAALTAETSAVVEAVKPVETSTPKPATFAELKAGCVGVDDSFICSQLAASATLPVAQAAWMATQNERIEAAKQSKPGVEPVGTAKNKTASGVDFGDAKANWDILVAEGIKAGKLRPQAVRDAVVNNPDAHHAYLDAHNAAVKS